MLCSIGDILGVNKDKKYSVREKRILELLLYKYIYDEMHHRLEENYFFKEEHEMVDGYLIRSLVNDLLINKDYSISGLACYTGIPEDVIYDISAGINNDPTITVSNKIIGLHFMARRELYVSFVKRFTNAINK